MRPSTPIVIKDEFFILEEAYVDSSGHTIWNITDTQTNKSLVVHTSNSGTLFIKFFKHHPITKNCSLLSITKICEILLERNLKPSINIHYTNTALILLCKKIGFRKVKDVKHLYRLKKLNNKPI